MSTQEKSLTAERMYRREEELTLRFYQMPKALFGNPRYEGLSLAAKAMYSILRDRQDLSIKNNWTDEEGYIYLVFDIDTLAELIEMNRKTVMTYKKELVQYGLLIDKRMGQGKANRLYVLKPEPPLEITETLATPEKSENGTSRNPKNGLPEVQKLPTNDTDFNNTEKNDLKDGWLGGNAAESQINKSESFSNTYISEKQAEQEFNIFLHWCHEDYNIARDFFKVWKTHYAQCPLPTAIAMLRDVIEDQYNLSGTRKMEYGNIAGVYHHRMKEWISMQAMYKLDPMYERYSEVNTL